ncbi:hypothetical protein [Lysobacter sp. Root690]|uniref:hypothetical protein n=1 Tax=Lysobacter sp. Root690 TaxID=1736588 RepID=UPI000A99AA71|nr:hypothetical protein [Lysobacter sp. Root690]
MIAKSLLPLAMLSALAMAPLSVACANDDPIVRTAKTSYSTNHEGPLYTQLLERPDMVDSEQILDTHLVVANNELDCTAAVFELISDGWAYPAEKQPWADVCAPSRGVINELVPASRPPGTMPGLWISDIARKPDPGQTTPTTKGKVVSTHHLGTTDFMFENQMSPHWQYDAQPEDKTPFGTTIRTTQTKGTLIVDGRIIGQRFVLNPFGK